jgi:hypothetical protein
VTLAELAHEALRTVDLARPDVAALAMLASLARKIEPELLRTLRLELSGRLPAGSRPHSGTEAALWFSPLVESRGPDSITMVAEISRELQDRLKAQPQLFEAAHEVIEELHRDIVPTLRWEERLVYVALTQTLTEISRQHRIKEAAREVLEAISTTARPGLEERVREMWTRLPAPATTNPYLANVHHFCDVRALQRGDRANRDDGSLQTILLQVRRTGQTIRIGFMEGAALAIRVPALDPVVLDVLKSERSRRAVRTLVIALEQWVEIPFGTEPVVLRTINGQIYSLVPEDFDEPLNEWLKYAPKPRPLAERDRWNVFLSYRSVNRAWALNLYDVLCQLGHKVFLDQMVLRRGDQFNKELEDALVASQAGVLIWSSASADSTWAQQEYQALEHLSTDRRDFRWVPVRLDRSELPLFAQSRIFIDFADYPDGPSGGELLRLLHAIAGIPLSEEAARFASEQDEVAQQAANKIASAIDSGNAKQLVDLFQQGGLPWRMSPLLGCKAAEGLTKLGRNDEALIMLEQVQAQFPKAIRPKQLRALALTRRAANTGEPGGLMEAQSILAELYQAGVRDPETLGLYGRTWMDRYQADTDVNSLRKSRDLYAEAFDRAHDDYYAGINAAAKSVLLGTPEDLDKARDYAKRVEAIVGTRAWPGDYWKTVTAAEVSLFQKNYAKAAELYQAALAISSTETASHQATWTQASRLMAKLGTSRQDEAVIRQAFGRAPEAL